MIKKIVSLLSFLLLFTRPSFASEVCLIDYAYSVSVWCSGSRAYDATIPLPDVLKQYLDLGYNIDTVFEYGEGMGRTQRYILIKR